MKRWLLIASLMLAIAGCAGIPNQDAFRAKINAWEGHDVSQLVKSWGRPNNILNAPDGTAIYTYYKGQLIPTTCTVDFIVDSAKKIVGWRFTGTACRTVY